MMVDERTNDGWRARKGDATRASRPILHLVSYEYVLGGFGVGTSSLSASLGFRTSSLLW